VKLLREEESDEDNEEDYGEEECDEDEEKYGEEEYDEDEEGYGEEEYDEDEEDESGSAHEPVQRYVLATWGLRRYLPR
jgi:hypothetical protein